MTIKEQESEELTDDSQESEDEQALEEAKETEEESEESSEDIDYKAELEEELRKKDEKLKKAGHKIEELKKEKKENEYEEMDDDRIRKIVREENQSLRKDISRSRIQEHIDNIAKSEDEGKLIMFHYENSIISTGNVEEDVESAQAIANKKQNKKMMGEAMRALRSQSMKGKDGDSGQRKVYGPGEPEVSKENQQLLSRMKAKWDSKRKGWVTPSGRFVDLEKTKSASSYNA